MAEEEDKMAKGQRYEHEVRQRSYKALPHLFAFEGFWETAPGLAPLRILHNSMVGCYLGFHAIATHIAY